MDETASAGFTELAADAWHVDSTRLLGKFGSLGLGLIGFLGAINIPFYEEMAKRIHWWQYEGCHMISNTPYYIIIGELGIAIALALLARRVRDAKWHGAIAYGIAGGFVIFICYAMAYGITDQFARA